VGKSNELRALREQLGYRLEDVAARLGVSIATAQRNEMKPYNKLTLGLVVKYAQILRVDELSLLGFDRGDTMEKMEIRLLRLFRSAAQEGRNAALRLLESYQEDEADVKKGG